MPPAFAGRPVAIRAKPAPGATKPPRPDRTTDRKISAPSWWHFGRHNAWRKKLQCASAARSPLRRGPRMARRRRDHHHHAGGCTAHGGSITAPPTPPPTAPLAVLTSRTATLPRKIAGNTNRSATVRAPLRARPDSIFWVFFSLFLHTQGHLMRWTPPISHTPPRSGLPAQILGARPI